jgi:glycosyltransferase involved in cell wall biosynthesis
VCASAPIKGLEPIGFTFHNLRRCNPNIELRIYSSQKLHELADDEKTTKFFKLLKEFGVKILDPIPQKELAEVFREAWALLMPNDYPEICSNLILQAQSCGLPVITTPIGSAPEFIKNETSGLLTSTTPCDKFWFWKNFAEQACRLQYSDELHKNISKHSDDQVYDYTEICEKWYNMVTKMFLEDK